jgi:hypothetical protein
VEYEGNQGPSTALLWLSLLLLLLIRSNLAPSLIEAPRRISTVLLNWHTAGTFPCSSCTLFPNMSTTARPVYSERAPYGALARCSSNQSRSTDRVGISTGVKTFFNRVPAPNRTQTWNIHTSFDLSWTTIIYIRPSPAVYRNGFPNGQPTSQNQGRRGGP